ncbi:MAG: hypothetical protein U0587_17685 [Candidatus Binatia bacterium]
MANDREAAVAFETCPHCGQPVTRRVERQTADDAGSIPEEELLERFRRAYPADAMERVPRGERGEYIVDILRGALIELAQVGAACTERNSKGERVLAYVTGDEFKERLRGVLDAIDDLRNLQAEERKRHEGIWCAQEEAYQGIEKFMSRIQGQVRAIVEGRDPGRCEAAPRRTP